MRNPLSKRFLFPALTILSIGLLATALGIYGSRTERTPAIRDNRTAGPAESIPMPVLLPDSTKPVKSAEAKGLHNVYSLSPTLFCGSEPEGNEGFLSLQRMGVKTIVSVDGSLPNVALAEKNGFRYIHLPIGYDGVPRERILDIATVISNGDLFGTVYLHCHHGKHRGPAAALAAVRCIDPQFSADQAESLMKTIGTDPHYDGLFRDVRSAKPFDQSETRRTSPFVASVPPSSLVERMVAIDATMDRIKQLQKNGWSIPADHPDLVPAHEALQLVEHLKEVERLKSLNETMRRELTSALAEAVRLETSLRSVEPRERIDTAFRAVSGRCTHCHSEMRDHKPQPKPDR